MKTQKTRKKTKIIGKQEYINPITGELVEMYVESIQERDCNFEKIWLGHIIQALDIIGNKKIKVINYIMQNRNNDNLFIKPQREVEQALGISVKTINETFKSLQESDFLTMINRGVYRINPDIIFKGTRNNRMNILIMYENEKAKNNKEPEEQEEPEYTHEELLEMRIKEMQGQLESLIQEKAKISQGKL